MKYSARRKVTGENNGFLHAAAPTPGVMVRRRSVRLKRFKVIGKCKIRKSQLPKGAC